MFNASHRCSTLLLVAALTLLTAGCGAGGAAVLGLIAGVGTGGTGIAVITGFGSLIVDGTRRDDSQASFSSEEDQGTAIATPPTAAMLGHTVEFGYDVNGAMASVVMSPALVGPVTAVGTNSVTLLGTTVAVNTDPALGPVTALAGYASISAIQVGDRLAVYGLPKVDGQGGSVVQATLITQKPAGTGIRLTGYVSQLNASAARFAIGSNTIDAGAAIVSPAATALANGQLVTVWSNGAAAGSMITATNVRIKLSAASTGNLTLSGAISAYAGNASFKLLNVTVDASRATVAPAGTLLTDGKYVVVTGQYDAGSGKLTATAVTVYAPAAAAAVELHGTILNFVSASSFTVRGVVVDASSANFSGGAAKDLANGVFVDVTGAVANNAVKASAVTVVAANPTQAPSGATVDLMGTITSYDPATRHYSMSIAGGSSVSGTMGSGLFLNNGSASDLTVGKSIVIRGVMNNGAVTTSVVSFAQSGSLPGTSTPPTPGSSPAMTYMEGTAYNVTATSFMLNGVTIQSNGVTVTGVGGMMGGRGMMSGARVGVNVQYTGGVYVASTITLLNG